jgi:hypothetical protein
MQLLEESLERLNLRMASARQGVHSGTSESRTGAPGVENVPHHEAPLGKSMRRFSRCTQEHTPKCNSKSAAARFSDSQSRDGGGSRKLHARVQHPPRLHTKGMLVRQAQHERSAQAHDSQFRPSSRGVVAADVLPWSPSRITESGDWVPTSSCTDVHDAQALWTHIMMAGMLATFGNNAIGQHQQLRHPRRYLLEGPAVQMHQQHRQISLQKQV